MPKGVVKTKRDERIWKQAKKYVKKSSGLRSSKQFDDQQWGLVNKIFHAAKAKYDGQKLPSKYKKRNKDGKWENVQIEDMNRVLKRAINIVKSNTRSL